MEDVARLDLAVGKGKWPFNLPVSPPCPSSHSPFRILALVGAEKVRLQRSRIVQTLNVPQGYALGLYSLRLAERSF